MGSAKKLAPALYRSSRPRKVEWGEFVQSRDLLSAVANNCVIFQSDTRTILPEFPDSSVSCVITSPPYGKLKNYGSAEQLGFGQDVRSEYLPDLLQIFQDLFRVVESGGSMWIVLDMMRNGGETVVLPWEVITIAKEVGWSFYELVIWDKGKNLPWPNRGRFRGVCEYILLFGKGKLKTFNLDESRDSKNLSPYWVKYPERYHPNGKAPSDLWHFPIPNQGTWSGSKIKHQCPFPVGLVERMISITTRKDETILDPFSGSGIVPAVASSMERIGVGIELNERLVSELRDTGLSRLQKWIDKEQSVDSAGHGGLRNHIIQLRQNKFPKTLFAGMVRADEIGSSVKDDICAFIVEASKSARSTTKFGSMKLSILLRNGSDALKLKSAALKLSNSQPLSLFGLDVEIDVLPQSDWSRASFISKLKTQSWYRYQRGKFFAYDGKVSRSQLLENLNEQLRFNANVPPIFSNLALAIEPPPKDSISL